MKASLLFVLVGFFISVSWLGYLGFEYLRFNVGSEVMVDGITISILIVTVLSTMFSIASWSIFSWASKCLSLRGLMLSVILGVALITPFKWILGPMAAIMVGIAAGSAAYMIQKRLADPTGNRSLVVGVITIVASCIILLAITISVQPTTVWDEGMGIGAWSEDLNTKVDCGSKYMSEGKDTCVLDPQFIEPNTVLIYDVIETSGTRLSIAPYDLIMNLTDGNAVRFVNDGSTAVNIFDDSEGIWSFDVAPLSQRVLLINNTGFYKILIQNSLEGESGRIVALSADTHSLPVEIKAKMAQTIVGSDFGKNVGLVGVGSGGAEPGITIDIDEKLVDNHDDAEQYYLAKYKDMIPFDVPIRIEFRAPFSYAD